MKQPITILWDQFCEEFKPDLNFSNQGVLMSTKAEIEYVNIIALKYPNRIWTMLNCNGKSIIKSGFSILSNNGYLVCRKSFKEGDNFEVLNDDMDEDFEEFGH